MYHLIRSLLFLFPAETAHNLGIWSLKALGTLHRLGFYRPRWPIAPADSPMGVLPSPVGLAAGFDKNAEALWGWQALGLGFIEVGTVTPVPQEGNPQPRLFRVQGKEAIVNRMGFNNSGAAAIAERIRKAKAQGLQVKVGGNIGKNKNTPEQDAPKDYQTSAKALVDCVDYFVINVSSPNTPGLRGLQNKEALEKIIVATLQVTAKVPVFIKVAPDHFKDFIEGISDLVKEYKLAGVICGNTLAGHSEAETGGLSGHPLKHHNIPLAKAYKEKGLFVIGVGGIDDAATAREYQNVGANLIQLYSGLVYQGPGLIKQIVKSIKN